MFIFLFLIFFIPVWIRNEEYGIKILSFLFIYRKMAQKDSKYFGNNIPFIKS